MVYYNFKLNFANHPIFFIVPYSIDILIRIESDDFDSDEEEDGLEKL